MRLLFLLGTLSLTTFGFATPSNSTGDGAYSLDQSWKQFQQALKNSEQNSILPFLHFPFKTNLAKAPGFERVMTRDGFIEKFDLLLPLEARKHLLELSSHEVFHPSKLVDQATPDRWRIVWNDGPDEDGLESSILYTFEKTAEGKVILVGIDVAG